LHMACVWFAYGICFERRLPYIESLIMKASVFLSVLSSKRELNLFLVFPGKKTLTSLSL
jgi:hypothetical protein